MSYIVNEPPGFSIYPPTYNVNQTALDGWGEHSGNGHNGTQGMQGPQGFMGRQGTIGFQGFADLGLQGFQGTQGEALPRGLQGSQGKFSNLEGTMYSNILVGQTGLHFGSTLQSLSDLYVNTLQGSTFIASTSIPTIYIDSDLVPETDSIYNLGFTGLSFLAAYFSQQSVVLGNVSIGVSSSSNECLLLKLTTPLGQVELVNSASTDNKISPSLFDIPSFVYGFCKFYSNNEPYSNKTDWTNQVYSMIYLKNPGYDGLDNPLIPSDIVPLDIDTYINALNGSYYIIQFDGGETTPSVELILPYMEFPAEGNVFYFQELTYYNTINYSCGAGDVIFCTMSRSADRTKFVVMMNKVDFFITGQSIGSARFTSTSLDNTKIANNSFSSNSFAVGSVGYPKIDPSIWNLYMGMQGTTGSVGSSGFQGIQGYGGSQGSFGTQGPTGPSGQQGFQGQLGMQGGQGNIGFQGGLGLAGTATGNGVQGFQGTTGPQGLIGPVGFQGVLSDTGFQGTQGRQGLFVRGYMGLNGEDGFYGNQGIQGFPSSDNPLGFQGNIGSQGYQGLIGRIGRQGPQGKRGMQGLQSDTYSADFGPQGYTGRAGIQGVQGPQGRQGYDNTVGPQGLYGAQGTIGTAGFIGFVCGATGTGTQGAQGPVGGDGIAGIQGMQGNAFDGSQGTIGYVGFQGCTGSLGLQGKQIDGRGWALTLTSSVWTTYLPRTSAVINWTSIGINGVSYNEWDWNGGSVLTCPATGWYWFSVWLQFNNGYSNEVGISVTVNETVIQSSLTNGAINKPYVGNPQIMTGCIYLNENDSVVFSVYSQNPGSNGITASNPIYLWIYGLDVTTQ